MYYAQMGIRGDDNIVAMDSWPGHNGTNCTDISDPVLVLMTAGKNYAGLNNTQCSITLNQTLFEININTTSRTITVNPTSAPAVDLDPTGRVACLTALTGVQLCLINTSLYTSTLGDMFASNIENVRSQHSSSANETDYTMRGIADTLMSLIDDALVAYASAQLMIAKDTTATSAMVDFKALQIGDRRYIYAIGILNVCIILLFLAGTVKTSG